MLFVTGSAVASCGSAFCMVNTNWGVQGVWNEPGFRGDLRFEYIDQDQPRTGTTNIAVGEIPRHHDEVRTINRNLFATLDYGISEALGVSVNPAVGRPRARAHPQPRGRARSARRGNSRASATCGSSAAISFRRRRGSAGDAAAVLRRHRRIEAADRQDDGHQRRRRAGRADAATRYRHDRRADRRAITARRSATSNASWFVQANFQLPINSVSRIPAGQAIAGRRRRALGRDRQAGPDAAAQRAFTRRATPAPKRSRKTRAARTFSLSPGFTYAVTPTVQVYAFVQLPMYQRVNGVQLIADRSYAVGVSAQF